MSCKSDTLTYNKTSCSWFKISPVLKAARSSTLVEFFAESAVVQRQEQAFFMGQKRSVEKESIRNTPTVA